MKLLFLCILATAHIINGAHIAPNDYHEKIGIPLATRLKKLEKEAVEAGQTKLGRIAGGRLTDISEVPYQAGVVIEIPAVRTSCCGGALISSTRVLTAAHCYYEGAINSITLGSNFVFYGGIRVPVTNWINHPGYSSEDPSVNHDLAIIHIPAVSFTDLIQPVSLPTGGETSNNFVGELGLISGYGITPEVLTIVPDQRLSSVNAVIISPQECGSFFGTTGSRDVTICTSGTGGVGACSSDSGGPLTIISNGRRLLVGIVSFAGGMCGSTTPTGYVRITSYLSWILSH